MHVFIGHDFAICQGDAAFRLLGDEGIMGNHHDGLSMTVKFFKERKNVFA